MGAWTHRVTGKRVLALFGLWAVFQAGFGVVGALLGGNKPPDLLLFADADALRSCLEALGPEGRANYKFGFLLDTGYPVVYGALLAGCIVLGARALGREALGSKVALLPLVAALFDWSENVGVMVLLSQWPAPSAAALSAVGVFNSGKWGFAFASLAVALPAAALAVARRRRST